MDAPHPYSAWLLNPLPEREALVNELHARPFMALRAPLEASHLAVLSGELENERNREHLAELCRRFGTAPPASAANYHVADLGEALVRWERHTEFTTYTFYRQRPFAEPFRDPAIAHVPADWLRQLPGQLLVAVHLALENAAAQERDAANLAALCGSDRYVGSLMAGGKAIAWSDFRLNADGFVRILARDRGLNDRQAGRLVQRLLEVETYRTAALLAFPLALKIRPRLRELELELTGLTSRIAEVKDLETEQALLAALTRLDAETARLASQTSYRFGAARAYYSLVRRRIAELRESRIEGLQTWSEFMDRRLAPAMETCESVSARINALAVRVAQAGNSLRTVVDVALQAQNRDLLRSMNRRAQLQLRLQQTVEGLSVVAISYYAIGLLGYGFKGLANFFPGLDPELLQAGSLLVVVPLVWAGVRRLRHLVMPEPGPPSIDRDQARPSMRS
ncbi:MAG: hypothetical protein KatS3mg123_0727 [Burkholderiales bacterium]|nr:MAG: hypothetical protein KatS3mg123_0727 [Burkholderiales bacterium]